VNEVARERSATTPQAALAWLRAQPMVTSVILGARTPSQLEDNLGAANLELSAEEITKLNQASAPSELYPYNLIDQWRRVPNP